MYWFMISATPKPGTLVPDGVSGAYVACWVDFKRRDGAELLARHYLEEAGWAVESVEKVLYSEESDYAGAPEMTYFRQAQSAGASFVFGTYGDG